MSFSTSETIRNFIVHELQWNGSREALADDYPLIDMSVLDSLDLLKLVSHIEDEFAVEVADEDLVADNFATISSIVAFVESRRT